ncbi:MAG: NAD-dependent epimerase/dehydratase family protein [Chloroflexi bacterium]|nr:NAD-dependent epimerase/dehydratase family protein [Chloroflexota bacterium]
MNVLVTGATGFIGSHLCRELINRGHYVLGLSYSGRTHNINSLLPFKEFHLQRGDIRDADMVRDMIKNHQIKAVFHLAAKLPGEDDIHNPFLCFDTNARGTLNVLNAAYLNSVENLIYASTMSVYSEPPHYLPVDENHLAEPSTIYGIAKLVGELYANFYSKAMNTIILRYSGAYGRGQRESDAIPTFISQALNNRPITIHGDGRQTSDFVFIDDVVQGTILAWEKAKPGVYNIGSGEEMSVRELAKRLINLTNSKSEIALSGEATERPFRFFLDITKAQKTFNYSPRSLDRGLHQYLEELKVEV